MVDVRTCSTAEACVDPRDIGCLRGRWYASTYTSSVPTTASADGNMLAYFGWTPIRIQRRLSNSSQRGCC